MPIYGRRELAASTTAPAAAVGAILARHYSSCRYYSDSYIDRLARGFRL